VRPSEKEMIHEKRACRKKADESNRNGTPHDGKKSRTLDRSIPAWREKKSVGGKAKERGVFGEKPFKKNGDAPQPRRVRQDVLGGSTMRKRVFREGLQN